MCQASGRDFRRAMIHTTIVGLAEDEPFRSANLRQDSFAVGGQPIPAEIGEP
jgi:hypothetical protein